MIDKQYLESAKNIRYEFLNLSKKLDSYHTELIQLFEYLQNVTEELNELNSNEVSKIKSASDATIVGNKIVKKMEEIESEEQKLLNLVKPINDRIDRLREEENILYKKIKQKYPSLTDDEIKKEISIYLL
jgi:chromosome segregation ATPase